MHPVKITSDNFKQGDFIPEALAWGRIGEDGSTVRSTPPRRACGARSQGAE